MRRHDTPRRPSATGQNPKSTPKEVTSRSADVRVCPECGQRGLPYMLLHVVFRMCCWPRPAPARDAQESALRPCVDGAPSTPRRPPPRTRLPPRPR
eukprot:scaffold12018_cov130-Isochrysis_galbana.AAC.2